MSQRYDENKKKLFELNNVQEQKLEQLADLKKSGLEQSEAYMDLLTQVRNGHNELMNMVDLLADNHPSNPKNIVPEKKK